MEIELQNIIREKKEVYRQLEIAIKDLRFVETILIEIEEEHDKAIVKIELLKNEVVFVLFTNPKLRSCVFPVIRSFFCCCFLQFCNEKILLTNFHIISSLVRCQEFLNKKHVCINLFFI